MMHYIYITCIGYIFSIAICGLIPPYTIAQSEYVRKYYTREQIEIHNTLLMIAFLFPAFKLASILVNYLGW